MSEKARKSIISDLVHEGAIGSLIEFVCTMRDDSEFKDILMWALAAVHEYGARKGVELALEHLQQGAKEGI
jgi:hypothetical protein